MSKPLPPIPKRLPSTLGPIKVKRVKDLKDSEGHDCHGIFHWDRRLIELNSNLEGATAWQVVFHEYIHAGLSDGGMDQNMGAGVTEAVADILATSFTGLLLSGTFTTKQKAKRRS